MATEQTVVLDYPNTGNRLESVSRVAIRNINPHKVDPNDPDQKKLIEHLKLKQANIWEYSDNQPEFLAKLNKNNPQVQRRAIESIVKVGSSSLKGSISTVSPSAAGEPGTVASKAPYKTKETRQLPQNQHYGGIQLSTTSKDEEPFQHSLAVVPVAPPEMKMVIKKTMELVIDMSKSVELVYHAVRATARFLTYPTPSVPSDNYPLGHVKGWIWLIYKAFIHFNSSLCEDPQLEKLITTLRMEMSRLATQSVVCRDKFQLFYNSLKELHELVKKEAKFMKSQSAVWALRVDSYFRYIEDLKAKRNLLLDLEEDRPFSADWAYQPHPSKANVPPKDFFHFQWFKRKKEWEVDEFEVRSDYSNRWTSYTELKPELQVDLIIYMIQHLKAILEESTTFIEINMHLSFDFDEVKCLKFAVAEIHSAKKNTKTVEYIGDMTKKLFEDMALLEEISEEFMEQVNWIAQIMDPCFESLKAVNCKGEPVVEPLTYPSQIHVRPKKRIQPTGCCSCLKLRSNRLEFLQLYGEPMEAVLLRTPTSEDIIRGFFLKENLIDQEHPSLITSSKINAYGVSEGYKPSIFDHAIGRDPPTKIPQRLPKFRRQSLLPEGDMTFNLRVLVESTEGAIRDEDSELDMEIYLQMFEQIKKFFKAFGSTFNFIISELSERLEKLENKLYTQLSDYYESLEKMVAHEVTAGVIQSDPLTCGTRAFRRVNVVLLFFTLFIDDLTRLEEYEPTSYICKTAYYKSYSKYHSWFTQKTNMFSIYSIPVKKQLYGKICPDFQIVEVDNSFRSFFEKAQIIYEHAENVFKNNQLVDL